MVKPLEIVPSLALLLLKHLTSVPVRPPTTFSLPKRQKQVNKDLITIDSEHIDDNQKDMVHNSIHVSVDNPVETLHKGCLFHHIDT